MTRWSVGVEAEGDRDMTHDEILSLADAVATAGGIATGIGTPRYGAQLVVVADSRDEAIAKATRQRLERQAKAGVLRDDVPLGVLTHFLELAYDGMVKRLAMGGSATDFGPVLDLIEERLAPFGVRPHWGKLYNLDPASQYPRLGDFAALASDLDPAGKFRTAVIDGLIS